MPTDGAPERTVTVVVPVMLPTVAVTAAVPAALPTSVFGLPLSKLAMVVSLMDQVASGRGVPVWSTAVKACVPPMVIFGVGGVTVSEVGADMLTVTLKSAVVVFPATSNPTTSTVLDTVERGTVHEKEVLVTVAGAPVQAKSGTFWMLLRFCSR